MADYFLKINGIPGESQNPRHQGEIEVESFSWSESYLASAGGTGKVHMQDLHITKPIDKASPLLMLACASGRHFTSACSRRNGRGQSRWTISLSRSAA